MRYVIVGNSAAGISAAETIRLYDKNSKVNIISEEKHQSYCRIFLPQLITGEKTLNDISFRSPSFYVDKRINLVEGKKVEHLDGKNKLLHIEDGQCIPGDRILVATGARPVIPSVEGIDLKGIFTARTCSDAFDIKEKAQTADKVVVVGAGFVALKIAEALCKNGLKVHIIKRSRFIRRMMDQEGSDLLEQAVKSSGVEVHTSTVKKIMGNNSVESIILDDGKTIKCNMVVIAMGVQPNLDLVKNSGIKTDDGILVNQFMETNIPGIYAAGDVAQMYDPYQGVSEINALWPHAVFEGKCAGASMTRQNMPKEIIIAKNIGTFFGLGVASSGKVIELEANDQFWVNRLGSNYCKLVFRRGKLIGTIFIGYIDKAGFWANAAEAAHLSEGYWGSLGEEAFSMGQILGRLMKNEKPLALKKGRI